MSSESIIHRCPPTCPTVKKQIRAAIAEAPWLLDEFFPRKKNNVNSPVPSDIIPKDTRDEPKRVIEADVLKAAVDNHEKIETIPSKILEDITARSVEEQIVGQEVKIVEEPVVISTKKITDRDDEKIVIPTEKIADRDDKKIDLAEEREVVQETAIIREPTTILTEKIDYNGEKIDLVEERELIQEAAIIQEPTVTLEEKIVNRDAPTEKIISNKKIDLTEAKELVREAEFQEPTVAPAEKIDRDEIPVPVELEKHVKPDEEEEILTDYEKFIDEELQEGLPTVIAKETDLITEEKIPIAIKKIVKDEIEEAVPTETDLEPSVEAEEYFELEKRVKPDEEEEILTDYERFIDEELQEGLPVVIAKEIPEEPRKVRREISKDAATLYDGIDRERAVRPPGEQEATTLANSTRPKRIVSRRAAQDACDETCPLVKEQKGEQKRIVHKLKEQQRIIEHYYLTKGFSYFEDVCTCSLACMMYTLSRDPFVRSIFASLALFAVGLKLCSELDAWEMPSRVS